MGGRHFKPEQIIHMLREAEIKLAGGKTTGEGLMAFVNSAEFREAKKLRDEIADVHFMMWLPAVPPGSLPH